MRSTPLIVGGAALALLALPLIVISLLGSWVAWDSEQIIRWVAGALGIALLHWGWTLAGRGFARRRWAVRQEAGLPK